MVKRIEVKRTRGQSDSEIDETTDVDAVPTARASKKSWCDRRRIEARVL